MDEFDRMVSIADPINFQPNPLPRRFLSVQQHRAEAYSKLKQQVFSEYVESGGELAYQPLCSSITVEFNDCSKQVIEMEAQLMSPPNLCCVDLAQLLRAVQMQEKEKLQLVHLRVETVTHLSMLFLGESAYLHGQLENPMSAAAVVMDI